MLAGLLVSANFLSCSNEVDENERGAELDDVAKYDENNYSFNTIDLWGSEAAVVDAGDYYIFQGDIYIDKKDIENPETRGAGVLNRKWPDNKIYYTLSGMTDAAWQPFSDALSYIEERTYLNFVPRLENEN